MMRVGRTHDSHRERRPRREGSRCALRTVRERAGLDLQSGMAGCVKKNGAARRIRNYQPRVAIPDEPKLRGRSVDVILVCNTCHYFPEAAPVAKCVSSMGSG